MLVKFLKDHPAGVRKGEEREIETGYAKEFLIKNGYGEEVKKEVKTKSKK